RGHRREILRAPRHGRTSALPVARKIYHGDAPPPGKMLIHRLPQRGFASPAMQQQHVGLARPVLLIIDACAAQLDVHPPPPQNSISYFAGKRKKVPSAETIPEP